MSAGRIIRTSINLGLLGLVLGAILNYQYLADQWASARYTPSTEISAFMSRVQLSNAGKASLYRTNPTLDDKAAFNRDCQTHIGELELGCYFRNRVYILRISNPDLSPEMDAVTSHELLHATWDRMSASERQTISRELKAAYARIRDAELVGRMASYAKTEPGQQDNELHSILGTEYAVLSPALEAHYAKYFINRAQVVAQHAAYKDVFARRKVQLEAELAAIRGLKAQLASINATMDSYRASGNTAAYNALVSRQNALVRDVNSRIEVYRSAVDEYNALSVALDSQQIQAGE